MPLPTKTPKLDRRIRLIVWAVGTRVQGIYQRGPVVMDGRVWAARPSNVAQFGVRESGGIEVEAKDRYIVRALKVEQNGPFPAHDPVYPYPAGIDFLVVDRDGQQFFVTHVSEVGRGRFLELTVERVTTRQAGITFAGGVFP